MKTIEPTLRISTWDINLAKRYGDYVSSVSLITNIGEPLCYQEEMNDTKSAKWKIIMKVQMDTLDKINTWDLVELKKDIRVSGCKWVYNLKKGIDGNVERYQTRFVAKEYS